MSFSLRLPVLAALAIIFIAASPSPSFAQSDATTSIVNATSTATTTQSAATTTVTTTQMLVDTEARVRAYFADIPVMIEIARCESRFRQFNPSGSVLHGGMGGSMVGIFQIASTVHASYALGIGMDINTIDGNLAYARRLYEQEGTQPWISSYSCWGNSNNALAASTQIQSASTTSTVASNLTLGIESPQVVMLQKLLNSAGFPLAASGPGSPGNETSKFGSLTRAALRSFQCAKGITCAGDEYSTGYGLYDDRTKAALTNAANSSTEIVSSRQPSNTNQDLQYSSDQLSQIAQLQAQIVTLQGILAALLQKRAV